MVAALTIPVVVAKYQQKAYYTAFMKSYNTLTNMMDLSINDNGLPDTWAFDHFNHPQNATRQYMMPYLKVNKICNEDNLFDCVSETYSDLLGEVFSSEDEYTETYGETLVLALADGSTLCVSYSGTVGMGKYDMSEISFIIDTNGKKGPNIQGRDIFYLMYFMPDNSASKWEWDTEYKEEWGDCDPNSNRETSGHSCATKLLQEGAMNY